MNFILVVGVSCVLKASETTLSLWTSEVSTTVTVG